MPIFNSPLSKRKVVNLPTQAETLGYLVTSQGPEATTSISEIIRQLIHNVVSTPTGEVYGEPAFGCDVQTLVFSPNDTQSFEQIVDIVQRAIERNIRVNQLTVALADGFVPDFNSAKAIAPLVISYQANGTIVTDSFDVAINTTR